jgi:hypothetical protein
MAGIYIKGMKMPTDRSIAVKIYPDGRVIGYYSCDPTKVIGTAIPVPPHGALMDMDEFFAACPELVDGYKRITDGLVVIPASEEGE